MIYFGVATAETQSIRKNAGIEGSFEFGQKNISTLKRNLLNADEILRTPYNHLLVNIRGNKPLLLEKMIYTEHELASKLKDISVANYCPDWNKNNPILEPVYIVRKEITPKEVEKEESIEITFDNF